MVRPKAVQLDDPAFSPSLLCGIRHISRLADRSAGLKESPHWVIDGVVCHADGRVATPACTLRDSRLSRISYHWGPQPRPFHSWSLLGLRHFLYVGCTLPSPQCSIVRSSRRLHISASWPRCRCWGCRLLWRRCLFLRLSPRSGTFAQCKSQNGQNLHVGSPDNSTGESLFPEAKGPRQAPPFRHGTTIYLEDWSLMKTS
jgi:hypothetical protein